LLLEAKALLFELAVHGTIPGPAGFHPDGCNCATHRALDLVDRVEKAT
jgi:hypothetical protein